MHHRAKMHANQTIRCRDMTIFSIFKDGVLCHLGFRKLQIFTMGRVHSLANKYIALLDHVSNGPLFFTVVESWHEQRHARPSSVRRCVATNV